MEGRIHFFCFPVVKVFTDHFSKIGELKPVDFPRIKMVQYRRIFQSKDSEKTTRQYQNLFLILHQKID